MRTGRVWILTCLVLGLSVLCTGAPGVAQETSQASKDGVLGAIVKSLTGDVYADPSRWRELSWSTFFTEGWDEAWVSPPPGGGGAPRQGWLNAFDGVFYRLGIATYAYGENSAATATRTWASSSSTCRSTAASSFASTCLWRLEPRRDGASTTNFGDFQIMPRFIVSESGTSPSRSTWPSARRRARPSTATALPRSRRPRSSGRTGGGASCCAAASVLRFPYGSQSIDERRPHHVHRQSRRRLLLHAARHHAVRRSRGLSVDEHHPADRQSRRQRDDRDAHAGLPDAPRRGTGICSARSRCR